MPDSPVACWLALYRTRWRLQLPQPVLVTRVVLYNRAPPNPQRLNGAQVYLSLPDSTDSTNAEWQRTEHPCGRAVTNAGDSSRHDIHCAESVGEAATAVVVRLDHQSPDDGR
eukprot:COSAG05_NODE_405_length_10177_cov_2.310776_3_plen_112_part_00